MEEEFNEAIAEITTKAQTARKYVLAIPAVAYKFGKELELWEKQRDGYYRAIYDYCVANNKLERELTIDEVSAIGDDYRVNGDGFILIFFTDEKQNGKRAQNEIRG
jgi:hypothetical protein